MFNRRTAGCRTEWHLHTSGVPALDSVFIENNAPLVARDAPEVLPLVFACVATRGAGRRFADRAAGCMIGLPGISAPVCAAVARLGTFLVDAERVAPYRDLVRLRLGAGDLLPSISANARAQIRRSIRNYTAAGPLCVDRANTPGQALSYFEDLVRLHRAHWHRRGRTGAFDETTIRFHRALIAAGLARGEIDLLRISAGVRTIGYLYNFVFDGVVSAYQSGFAYDDASRHEKPGLTCHYAAIGHYLARPEVVRYDFLAGAARYKTSLSDGSEPMFWARFAPGTMSATAMALRMRAVLRTLRHGGMPGGSFEAG